MTVVLAPTLPGTSSTVASATACDTGRIVELDENALYGWTPPLTVSVEGMPE